MQKYVQTFGGRAALPPRNITSRSPALAMREEHNRSGVSATDRVDG